MLRSSSQPEGFDHLTIAEIEQVLQANRLLLFTLRLFMLMTYAHRMMVVEHPILPAAEGEDWLPSIWRLYAILVYNLHSAVTWVDLYQGHYGGRSPKPTTLLVSCGPTLDANKILESYRSTDLPQALVMGKKSGSKEYSTAALKSYPGQLCRGLSGLAQQWLDLYVQNDMLSDYGGCMDDFLAFSEKLLQDFNLDVVRGSDYSRPQCHASN